MIVLLVCSIQSFLNLLIRSVFLRLFIQVLYSDDLVQVEPDAVDIEEYLSPIVDRIAVCDQGEILRDLLVMAEAFIDGLAGAFGIPDTVDGVGCNDLGDWIRPEKDVVILAANLDVGLITT